MNPPLPTILETREGLLARRFSARELVERCLARIDLREPTLRAWVSVDREGALQAADLCDQRVARGDPLRPLDGVTLGVKDLYDVAGWPTLAGSDARLGHVAAEDAPTVARLRAAGAIVLGKTVTTQFACFDPPATKNPLNLERTPGGSSSGSAAAVADGMCAIAVGSQTGGSIVRPASFCGLVGFKPRWKEGDLRGIVPLATSLDHPGPIARNVADTAIVHHVMTRDDWADADPLAEIDRMPVESLGWLKGFFWDAASEQVRATTAWALSRCGQEIVELPSDFLPCPIEDVHRMHRVIMLWEMTQKHGQLFQAKREMFLPGLTSLFEEGLRTTRAQYDAALEHREQFRVEISEKLVGQTIVMPATMTTAPTPETTGDPRYNSPWSYCGMPSATVPCGLAEDGMPCGLQIVGHTYLHVLAAARRVEAGLYN